MNSLTETSYLTRRIIKYSFLAIVALLLIRSGWGIFKQYWRARHPLPSTPPDVAFGKLEAIQFSSGKEKPQKGFILQTVSGDLPKMPDQAKVFFVIPQENQLLALEKTNQLAKNLGFSSSPEKIREDLYRYRNQSLKTILTINPLTKTFFFQYPYLQDQTLITLSLPPQKEIIDAAKGFLEKTGRNHDDLLPEKAKVVLWKITPNGKQPAPSLSEANLAQVNFFREDIENQYHIYPQDLKNSNVSVLVSGDSHGNREIVEVKYTYFYIDKEKSATYPLKPISQAWEELKSKDYHLAKLDSQPTSNNIPIRQIYLAYLDPHYPTNFLQPIYVFEGDYGFFGFVPAISIEWVSE